MEENSRESLQFIIEMIKKSSIIRIMIGINKHNENEQDEMIAHVCVSHSL